MPSEGNFSLGLSRIRRRLFANYKAARLVLLSVIALGVLFVFFTIAAPLLRLSKDFLFGPVNVFSVIMPNSQEIKNTNGRTNILLLGIGNPGHDGPNLSDSMMVISVKSVYNQGENPANFPIILLSVPRDIYLDDLNGKINTAYAIGVQKDNQTGLLMASGAVTEVTGLPIHYAVRMDFSGFSEVVDLLGGVDVNVEHLLDDYQYPIDGKEDETCGFSQDDITARTATMSAELALPCRYEHIHFDVGPTHMDGATVLKFVRSRHAQGDEGSDFARARRQQLVISALKSKIFSSQTLLDFGKLESIYNTIKAHVDTNADPSEANLFFQLSLKMRGSKFKSVVLDTDSTGLLINPPTDERGWILLPKTGNWDEVKSYIQSQINNPSLSTPTPKATL